VPNLVAAYLGDDRGHVHGLAFLASNAYCHFDIHQLCDVTEATVLGACGGYRPDKALRCAICCCIKRTKFTTFRKLRLTVLIGVSSHSKSNYVS